MARQFFGIEKLLRIFKENSNTDSIDILFGSAAPGNDSGEQDDAAVGSLYILKNGASSTLYQKIGSADALADWKENGSASAVIGKWREEKVSVLTDEVQGVGTRDMVASPFTDDDGTAVPIGDYIVGQHIITGAAGTPVLLEITAVVSDDVTFAAATTALAADDSFTIKHYLPDSPDDQEKEALVNYNGSVMVKLGDINWNIADGINMAAGYAAVNGSISASDTVNSAIQKLDGNQQDIQTASGLAQGDTSYGSFASPASLLLAAAQTSKALFQRLGDLLAQLRGVEVTGVTTITTLDEVPHATVKACLWIVTVFEEATPANRKTFELLAHTDGTTTDETISKILKTGANFDLTVGTTINGANMELNITSTTAGVTATARRIEVVKSVL